jgi:hypothetical protein
VAVADKYAGTYRPCPNKVPPLPVSDLVQAVSAVIAPAGALELTTRNLVRLTALVKTKAATQRDFEQAISDQPAAEAAHKAVRDTVRIFGKAEAEMDRVVADRKIDPTLVVPSPIAGRITARNAAPGLLVQPLGRANATPVLERGSLVRSRRSPLVRVPPTSTAWAISKSALRPPAAAMRIFR